MKYLFFLLFVTATFAACSPSTQITKTWMDPGATVSPGPENKALIIALVKDETSRRVIEDQLVKRFNSSAVQSYKIITPELLKAASDEALTQQVMQEKFTHILLMRLADVEKDVSYVPGTSTAYYGSYGRYYGYGANMYSSPGYYQTDKNYFIETIIYSVDPGKLLWTATTKTVNPSKIDKTVNDIADVVTARMKQDGFLVK